MQDVTEPERRSGERQEQLAPSVGRRRAAVLNVAFNYVTSASTIINGIILVPLYLSHLGLGTYGAWLASGNVLALIGIVEMGFNIVFSQRLSEAAGAGDMVRFQRVAASGVTLIACSAVGIAAAGLVLSRYVPGLIHAPAAASEAIGVAFAAASLGAGVGVIYAGLGTIVQAWQDPFMAGLSGVIGTIAGITTTILGLFYGWGVIALGAGALASSLASVAVLSVYLVWAWRRRRLPRPSLERRELISLAVATGPVFLGRTGGLVLGNSEAALTSMLVGPEAAAVLALTSRVYQAGLMFLLPFGSAAFSGISRLTGEGSTGRFSGVTREMFTLMGLGAAIVLGPALALNESFMTLWVGADRFGGLALSVAAATSVAVSTRVGLGVSLLTAMGHVKQTAWISLAELAVRIPILVLLVKWFGLVGLPLAVVVTSAAITGTCVARLMRRTGAGSAAATLFAGAIPLAVSLVVGGAFAVLTPKIESWTMLIGYGVLVASFVGVSILATSPYARMSVKRVAVSART